ncbi:hypothetical protein SG34_030590 [Thalassomonas viridans]|uniref:Tse2 ADP-ribosyltransferase toxin domain-containing protein n=1 Tax=Thalassomonas viridans TaxID=137584 RepID=A0AAF0CAY3_9GAMM|nr:hypothetical protein [Thalassomonas viridans]WDE09117.1 hypothetical protein SG34_030590 [Thalassomonas viridans]
MITLEEIIIARGDIEKVYKSNISLTLWRAVHKSAKGNITNPLYPDLKERELANGRIRAADVATYRDAKGVLYVKSEESRGTSLSDIRAIFGLKSWDYVVIPAKTRIPEKLIITKDHFVAAKKAWHYSISPNFDMPVDDFLAALDELAVNARIKLQVRKNAKY